MGGVNPSGIGGIPWASLRTASGTAERIPGAVAQLGSSNPAERKVAVWMIDNHAILQGDLHEAAPFTVLALIDALRSSPNPASEVYNLLTEFAYGWAPPTMTVTFEGSIVPVHDATLRALRTGLELYRRDLVHDDAGSRRQAAELLLALREQAAYADDVDAIFRERGGLP